MLEALKGEDNDVRIGVINVFGELGWDGGDAVEPLKKIYNDKDERIGKAVIEALRRIDENELPKIGVSRGKIAK